jgi:hypothetical protein
MWYQIEALIEGNLKKWVLQFVGGFEITLGVGFCEKYRKIKGLPKSRRRWTIQLDRQIARLVFLGHYGDHFHFKPSLVPYKLQIL